MPRTRRPFRTLLVGSVTAALVATAGPAPAANLAEQFDSIALPGWTKTNLSSPAGSNGWFQGNPMVFPAQAGATNAYIAANINSTTNTNTISNWLITPVFTTLTSTDVLSFYTRTPAGSHFPDRLEVRVSTNGSCSPGSTSTGVGDFTTLLTTINPTLAAGGYPESWTQFTLPLSGVVNPATVGGQATGCLAFRYFVTDGGPAGGNSNYIGIDTVSFADNGPDLTAPIVTITSGPAPRTSSPAPSFAFSANEPATFACRVYAQGATPPAFSPCSGPTGTHTPTANLNDGPYTFDVRATDPSFNTGDATRSFTVTASACATAKAGLTASQSALGKASRALHKAKAKLKKARKSGSATQVTKAEKAVKKAKASVKAAEGDVATAGTAVGATCV